MKIKILMAICFLAICSFDYSNTENKKTAFVKEPKSIDEQFTYAYLFDLVSKLKADSIKIDEELAVQAIRDVFKNDAKYNIADRQAIVTAMQDTVRVRSLSRMQNDGMKLDEIAKRIAPAQEGFLEKIKKEENLLTAPNGMLYKIINPGSGKSIAPDDILEVGIIGTFADGSEFDNTYKTGQVLNFPANGMFKGWWGAISLLKEGGKGKFIFPPDLAFGQQGAPPKIPSNAIVTFEVEVKKINGKYDPNKLKAATKGN